MSSIDADRRKTVTDCFVNKMRDKCQGIILVGSTAYANDSEIKEKSDIDVIVVYDNIKDCIPAYFSGKAEEKHLENSSYDGYLVKKTMSIDGTKIALSIHNLSYEALQRISYGNTETLAYYRQSHKDITYYSKDFDGENHPFRTPSYPIDGLEGERRIDSIAMDFDGKYVIGNDMDKLMSGAKVLLDTDGKVQQCIDDLWRNVARKMTEHHLTRNTGIDPRCQNLAEMLVRYERFSAETVAECRDKTLYGVNQAMYGSNGRDKPGFDKMAFVISQRRDYIK